MEVKRIYEISVGDIVAEDIFRGQLLLLAGGTIITEKNPLQAKEARN